MRKLDVAIDFGTSTSEIATLKYSGGQYVPDVFTVEYRSAILPSVVWFKPQGQITVGINAENAVIDHPDDVIQEIKREMGIGTTYQVGGEVFTSVQIAAEIFRKLHDAVFLPQRDTYEPGEVVIAVPHSFHYPARQEIKEAARLGGFGENIHLIEEGQAAIIRYGLDWQVEKPQNILIFDFGGGTLDVCICHVESAEIQVKGNSGDPQLGGKDIDLLLMFHIVDKFKRENPKIDTAALKGSIQMEQELIKDSTEEILGWSYIGEIITQDIIDPLNGNRLLSKGTRITEEKENYLIEEMGYDADELPNILRPYLENPKPLLGGTPHFCGVPTVTAHFGDGNSIHFCPRCVHIEKYPLFYYRNQIDELEYMVVGSQFRVKWADIYQQRFIAPQNVTSMENEEFQTEIQEWETIMESWTTYYRCLLRASFLATYKDNTVKCIIKAEDGFADIVGNVIGYYREGDYILERIINQKLVLFTDKGEQKIPDAQIEWVKILL